MAQEHTNIGASFGSSRPVIRQLDEAAVNRIAAGEVVERPASAVKELVENALDAGAGRIEVVIGDGGRSLIRVSDDGCGMTAEDLPLALSRHATSKIDGSDLMNIHTFGFRGEALPALAAVGRLSITSRAAGEPAAQITMTGGRGGGLRPAALSGGTVVELRDLFFATPARLKFLRSDRTEAMAVTDVVKRLAMAEPQVTFILRDTSDGQDRLVFRADAENGPEALKRRLAGVLGRDFAANSVEIEALRDGIRLTGHAALPTYSRGAAVSQHLFVNGRPVRDKLLIGALRAAYTDLMARDRHPAAALFIWLDPQEVDVNVHPAKAEVRFREAGLVRGLVISALRHALAAAGHRTSSTVADGLLGAARPLAYPPGLQQAARPSWGALRESAAAQAPGFAEMAAPSARADTSDIARRADERLPLGAARTMLHGTYILAQTDDGLVIVDAHAAHERLTYERLKRQMADNGVPAQALLIPEIVTLGHTAADRVLAVADDLARLGLTIEPFGPGTVVVRETPALLGQLDVQSLVRDIADALSESEGDGSAADGAATGLVGRRLDALLSRIACHTSVRAGRQLQTDEMNALLREMEATPNSGQCNHGRPTSISLGLTDIERLFART